MNDDQTEDMWSPYKELLRAVEFHLTKESQVPSSEFENILRKYKQNFLNLLQNPPKSQKSRDELKKGMTDGISVRGIGQQILSNELYQEVVILSDMYDLNEYMALDLLCTAQIQMSYKPGLTRGLVAVLLYYDGRKALVAALRLLVQARTGLAWRLGTSDAVAAYVTEYTDQLLLHGGLFARILELLHSLDQSRELELLQRNRALGNARHQRQVLDLFEDTRRQLADIVYMRAAQSGLPREPTILLIQHMRMARSDNDASGGIDDVTLTLQMALLYALDLSVLHVREDGEAMVQQLPLLSEDGLIDVLLAELTTAKSAWACTGLHSLSMFAFAICLGVLRLLPQCQRYQAAIEQEDSLLNAAIDRKLFSFLNNVLLKNELIYNELFYYHRIHNLFTDFIVLAQTKVKELRIRADEAARTLQAYAHEGLEAPATLPRQFEQFLLAVGKFYGHRAKADALMLEYWCPAELAPSVPATAPQMFSYRTPPRAISLFKFVRMAGDMVPPSLFVPYLRMLSGLASHPQAARYCFNMLKQNGPGCEGVGAAVANVAGTTVSWDHFFISLNRYLGNLRQEMPSATDTIYYQQQHHLQLHPQKGFMRGITPQEVQGLHAVLILIRTVAEYDEFSRVCLCEHPVWAPLSMLLGLVTCSVPIPLKAALLTTLAALSKSPETAAQMWNNLEASQILVTVPSTSSYQPRGIQTELEEIESRMEEYPMTRALLELLDVLTDSGIPRTLGAGPRKPGFDPYLTFIVNIVFLKFHVRAYKAPEEKWHVARLCLKLLDKFVSHYEPNAVDFLTISNQQTSEFNAPPGFHILVQLNSKSPFLELILYILDEGCSVFDSYTKHFPGKTHLEECTGYCLSILNRALTLQQKFFHLLSISPANVLLTHLTKLLLNVNPRTTKPDFVLTLCKFVGYQSFLATHSLTATKILVQMTRHSPAIHLNIVNILLSYGAHDLEIRDGFVRCLDADDVVDRALETDGDNVIVATKKLILKLLKQCLGYAAPNLAHYLCGFDVERNVSTTIFQFPGVLGFPRTCLHSLLSIMNSCIGSSNTAKGTLLESAYGLLYALCANAKTSGPVLKFIRQTQPSFARRHIQAIQLQQQRPLTVTEMNQLAWLLRTIAIEQKMCSATNQVFYVKHLTKLLVGFPAIIEQQEPSSETLSVCEDGMDLTGANDATGQNRTNLLKAFLKHFNFECESVASPQWDYFDNALMERLIEKCEIASQLQPQTVPRLIDVKKLHQALVDELCSLQGTAAASQRQLIMQEIQKVLAYAIQLNGVRQHAAAAIRFMDAWRQLAQVVFVTLSPDIMSIEEQQILLVELLETLLDRMLSTEPLPEIANLASSVALVLMCCVRKTHWSALKQRQIQKTVTSMLPNILQTNSSSLKYILHSLIEWILTSSVSAQRLRVHLYGTLLEFLHLVSISEDGGDVLQGKQSFATSFCVNRLDEMPTPVRENHRVLISANVVSSFGDRLIEVLCQDCIGGHDVCKMLAMSTFNMFIALNLQTNWLSFLSTKGYIKHLLDSILNSDNDLRALLETVPDTLRPMYMYETKMALVTRIASTRAGAEMLLGQRVLACLASMKVFDEHPKIERGSANVLTAPASATVRATTTLTAIDDFLPTVESRYQQVLFPALNLCHALVTSLGPENQSATGQVLGFLFSHLDVVEMLLQQAHPTMAAPVLKELALLTGLVARTATNDLGATLEASGITMVSSPSDNNRAYLSRLQRLMVALLPRFVLSDGVVKELTSHGTSTSETKSAAKSDRLLHAMQVAAHVLLYCRNRTASHGVDHGSAHVLFQPTFADPARNHHYTSEQQTPSIGIVIQQLIHCVQYYHKEKVSLEFLRNKVAVVATMNSLDLKEFVTPETASRSFSIQLIRQHGLEVLSERLRYKQREMDYTAFLIETALYLIWAHLDYYMLRAIPKANTYVFGISQDHLHASLISPSEATWKVSVDDISHLKQGLASIFNDIFSRQLIETTQNHSELEKGFVDALLRRIKRLIQFVPVK